MLKTLKDLDFNGKRVLLRVDFNVPMDKGMVSDDTRIVEARATIDYILNAGGLLTLAAHFGRPKGEKNLKYSLRSIADYINSKGFFKTVFVEDCIGSAVADALKTQQSGTVLLLENLRFYREEEANDAAFAKELCENYDCYVNDAFGTCHRKHASVYAVPQIMTHKAAGLLIEKEVRYFDKLVHTPDKPFAAILGGAKVSDKIGVIESLLNKADRILIGGAMAYSFLKYQGYNIGKSLVEDGHMSTVERILKEATDKHVELFLPIDHVISKEFGGKAEQWESIDIPSDYMGLDIGPKTAELYAAALKECKTVLWNGPMGVFENVNFARGTFTVAKALAALSSAVTVVGGGDSVAAVKQAKLADKMSHISTGGGASLEYIEFGTLPGIEALKA